MKYISLKTLLSLALMAFVLQACKPKEVFEPGDPFSSLKGIHGTWAIDQVLQVDKLSTKSDNSLDVSSFFMGASPLEITFNSDDFTWSVAAGDAPNYLGASGTWSFDDNDFPSVINIVEGSATRTFTLNRPVREQVDQYLDFTMERPACNGDVAVAYSFRFVRTN
jgi:hypothetical protein